MTELRQQILDIALYSHAAHEAGAPTLVAIHGGGFSGRYFDRPGYSIIDLANQAGFNVTLVDRPGYGASPPRIAGTNILSDHASQLNDAIATLCRAPDGPKGPIVLLGHSIGGAIALILATLPRRWLLAGVSVSGIGDEFPAGLAIGGALDREAMAKLFFSEGAATADALDALLSATQMPVVEELGAIATVWPTICHSVLKAIDVPTQIILSECETLWKTGGEVTDRLAAALSHAPAVDCRMMPGVGHCIEFHPQGADYVRQLLAFASQAVRMRSKDNLFTAHDLNG